MATSSIQLAYRPVRVGVLVRAGDAGDLLAAIGLNSAVWGGAFNPIVAVDRSVRRTDLRIRRSPADVLHPIAERAALEAALGRHRHLQLPMYRHAVVADWGAGQRLQIVDVSAPLAAWRERLGQPDAIKPFRFCIPSWERDDPFSLLYAATFGDLDGVEDLVPGFASRYSALPDVKTVPADVVAEGWGSFRIPLDITRALLPSGPPIHQVNERWPGVFVGDAASVADVAEYWNLRARGVSALFWDRGSPNGGPFGALVARQIETAKEAVDPEHPQTGWFAVYLPRDDRTPWPRPPDNLPQRIPEALRALLEPELAGFIEWHWGGEHGPFRFRAVEEQQILMHVDDLDEERSRLVVPLLASPFPSEGDDLQSLVVVLRGTELASAPINGTIDLPPLTDLNDWYSARMVFGGAVRVEDGAIGFVTSRGSRTLELATLSRTDLIHRIFERSGLTAERNPSGQTAHHLVRQLGGWNSLRIFRIPGVRKLFSRNDSITGLSRNQAKEAIRDRGSFDAAERFYVRGRLLDTTDAILDFLLHRRMFLPGLELQCPQCSLRSFFAAADLSDNVRCPKCGLKFLLAPALSGNQWRFRLSGLLENRPHRLATDQSDSQPEAIPMLLTLLYLGEQSSGSESVVFEMNHNLSANSIRDCETDFVALSWRGSNRTRPHMLLGECKGRGLIEAEDVEKLQAAADVIRESGIDADLVFSTTRDEFSKAELEMLRDHITAQDVPHPALRRTPIVLTRRDLESGRYQKTGVLDLSHWGGATFDRLLGASRDHYFPIDQTADGA